MPAIGSAPRSGSTWRNGYRDRDWDTRVGSIELAVPRLRAGSYFPDWLLQPRRRASPRSSRGREHLSAWRLHSPVEKPVQRLGSRRCRRARSPGWLKTSTRSSPPSAPGRSTSTLYTFVLGRRDRDQVPRGRPRGERAVLIAVGVNNDGPRDPRPRRHLRRGRRRLARLLPVADRPRPHRLQLVTSDAHPGLVDAIAATLPGASWQRCRTHFLRNLLTQVPKPSAVRSPPWCAPSSPSPTPVEVHAPFDGRRSPSGEAAHSGEHLLAGARAAARLHRLPPRALAPALVQQFARTAQPRDPPPHRPRRHLPRPRPLSSSSVGAVLAEQNDEWTEQRRYMGLEVLAKARLHVIDGDLDEGVTPTAITA